MEHGEGREGCEEEEQSERIERNSNRSLPGDDELGKDSPKRYDVSRKVGDGRGFRLQRQTQGVYFCICIHHCPVENCHRINDVSQVPGRDNDVTMTLEIIL